MFLLHNYCGFTTKDVPLKKPPRKRLISSGTRQKGESQNGCFKNAKHAKISEKQTCLFFRNFGMLWFLETPVLKFALLPYYRQFEMDQ